MKHKERCISPELQQRLFAVYPEIFANRDDRMFAISWCITCFDGCWCHPRRLDSRVLALTALAEERSCQICDLCGAPGRTRSVDGWSRTRCDIHSDLTVLPPGYDGSTPPEVADGPNRQCADSADEGLLSGGDES